MLGGTGPEASMAALVAGARATAPRLRDTLSWAITTSARRALSRRSRAGNVPLAYLINTTRTTGRGGQRCNEKWTPPVATCVPSAHTAQVRVSTQGPRAGSAYPNWLLRGECSAPNASPDGVRLGGRGGRTLAPPPPPTIDGAREWPGAAISRRGRAPGSVGWTWGRGDGLAHSAGSGGGGGSGGGMGPTVGDAAMVTQGKSSPVSGVWGTHTQRKPHTLCFRCGVSTWIGGGS